MNNLDYKTKYFKYKTKYLELKKNKYINFRIYKEDDKEKEQLSELLSSESTKNNLN